jgi:hypothetical protein
MKRTKKDWLSKQADKERMLVVVTRMLHMTATVRLLPGTPMAWTDRYIYGWCQTTATKAAIEAEFVDPSDGEVLTVVKAFETVEEARQWVQADVDFRNMQVGERVS